MRSPLNVVPAGLARDVDASSHHAVNKRRTSICTAPISSPLSPLTRGRDLEFGGIGGLAAKSLVNLLSLVAYCWRSGWEHFSSNNRRTVADRPGMKMQLLSFASVTVVIGSIIVFCYSNQPAMFLSTRFNRRQNYDVKFWLYQYTTENNWYRMIIFLVTIKT